MPTIIFTFGSCPAKLILSMAELIDFPMMWVSFPAMYIWSIVNLTRRLDHSINIHCLPL